MCHSLRAAYMNELSVNQSSSHHEISLDSSHEGEYHFTLEVALLIVMRFFCTVFGSFRFNLLLFRMYCRVSNLAVLATSDIW